MRHKVLLVPTAWTRYKPTLFPVAANMRTLIALAFCFFATHQLSIQPLRAETTDPVVAKVNGAEIHESDVALANEELGAPAAQTDASTRRQNIIGFLIDLKLAANATDGKKLRGTDTFKKQAAFALDRLSMDTLLARQSEAATTDAALKQAYEDATKATNGQQEVRIRHILVGTEDAARQAIDEVNKGGDFAAIAKRVSKGGSAVRGGDLGFVSRGQLDPDIGNAVFALDVGKISDPIKTKAGWQVVRVEEKRDRKMPAFDQIKPQLEAFVIRKAQAAYVAKLHEGAKIELFDLANAQSKDPSDAKASPTKTDKK
jgi:peptidyl-prolyl cis-trans isomerase C